MFSYIKKREEIIAWKIIMIQSMISGQDQEHAGNTIAMWTNLKGLWLLMLPAKAEQCAENLLPRLST